MSDPMLYWGVTHQTLVQSDVPALERVGFVVVVEEPELSVIRDSDASEYPVAGSRVENAEFLRGIRLWARNGLVTPSEARAFNRVFDAVMVHTRLDVARNIRSWFRGTIYFRHFGELPWVSNDEDVNDGSVDHSGIHYVPLLPSLLETPLSRTFDDAILMRSTITPRLQPSLDLEQEHKAPRIGLFVEKISETERIGGWVRQLAMGVPEGEVVVFGLEASAHGGLGDRLENVLLPPRLPERDYRALFSSLTALVYPYSNPRHIHYVPYEAVAIGIPVFALEGAPISVDLRDLGFGTRSPETIGISPDPEHAVKGVLSVVRDPGALAGIALAQRSVLQLLSPDTVVHQADKLRRAMSVPHSECVGAGVGEDLEAYATLPTYGARAFARAPDPGCSIAIEPAGVVTATTLGEGAHVEFRTHPRYPERLTPQLLAGKHHYLRLGMPAREVPGELFLRVTLQTSPVVSFPAELSTITDEGSSWSNFVPWVHRADEGTAEWSAVARVRQRDILRITVFGDQLDGPVDVYEIDVTTLAEGEWWAAREHALLTRIVQMQGENEFLAARARYLEAESSNLRLAAEEAGRWGADLERQVLEFQTLGLRGKWLRTRALRRR